MSREGTALAKPGAGAQCHALRKFPPSDFATYGTVVAAWRTISIVTRTAQVTDLAASSADGNAGHALSGHRRISSGTITCAAVAGVT